MIFLVVGTLVLVGMLAITESAFVFGEDLPFLVAVSVPLYFLIRAMRDAYFYVISYDTENVTVQTMMLSRREIPMVEISADTTNFQKFEGRDAKSKVFSFYTKMNNATDLRMRISEKRHAVESWGTDRV